MNLKDDLLLKGVRSERHHVENEIKVLNARLTAIQTLCPHTNATKVNRGSEGNILTGRDPSYWRECSCPDCGKVWTEDQ